MKSQSSVSLDVSTDFLETLSILYLTGLSGLFLEDTGLCTAHFDNSLDETTLHFYLQNCEEYRKSGLFHQLSLNPNVSPASRKDSLSSEQSTKDEDEEVNEVAACRVMQRHQHY